MKLIKSLTILGMLSMGVASPVWAFASTLSLSPAAGVFNKGCTFSLDIKLDTGPVQTDGTDTILLYDPTRFKATSIRSGTLYNDYPGNVIDEQSGRVTISGLASVSTPFSGSGTFATVNFSVLDNAPTDTATQIKFDFDPNDKAKTTDSNVVERGTVTDSLSSVQNGSYTIGTGLCGAVGPIITKTPVASGGGAIVPLKPKPPVVDDFTGNGNTAGIEMPTFVIAGIGTTLLILGIIGLALL